MVIAQIKWLGLWPIGFKSIFFAFLLNSMLFIGEIFYLLSNLYSDFRDMCRSTSTHSFMDFLAIKQCGKINYFYRSEGRRWRICKELLFAPFLEEILYRGIIFGLFRDCGTFANKPTQCLILLPLFFSFAHAHALY